MDEQLRVGDAEREQAAAVLGEHYVQGRLTTEEHEERVARIWAARTRGDLDAVFDDLPAPTSTVTDGSARPRRTPDPRSAYRTQRHCAGPMRVPVPLVIVAFVLLAALTPVTPLVAALLGVLVLVVVRRRRWAGRRWTGPGV